MTDGDEKYCLAAEDAMERTWRDEPAFPGINKTGTPITFIGSGMEIMIHNPWTLVIGLWLMHWYETRTCSDSHPTSRYSQSEYLSANGVHEELNSRWRR